MVVTVEGVNSQLNDDLSQWLLKAVRAMGWTKYVSIVPLTTYDAAFAEMTVYLDVHAPLSGYLRHKRQRDLKGIARSPARYVVVDSTLPLKDQRETALMALSAKLAQQGVQVCQHLRQIPALLTKRW